MEKVEYRGWPNCVRLANAEIELIVTTEVGPRMIRCGFIGDENEFGEYPDQLGKVGGDQWRIYGGHRLWHAPEVIPRTYALDNGPVQATMDSEVLRLVQPIEPETGVQKEMDIRLDDNANHVTVVHRLRNGNAWTVELSPWAVSVMNTGGVCIVPLAPYVSHDDKVQPSQPLILWAYTDLTDPRLVCSKKYIRLRQDPRATAPIKLGLLNVQGWAAYARNGHLFVIQHPTDPTKQYPDFNASLETFTNADMLEIETLAPLTAVAPGGVVGHVEEWWLHRNVNLGDASDEAIDLAVARVIPHGH